MGYCLTAQNLLSKRKLNKMSNKNFKLLDYAKTDSINVYELSCLVKYKNRVAGTTFFDFGCLDFLYLPRLQFQGYDINFLNKKDKINGQIVALYEYIADRVFDKLHQKLNKKIPNIHMRKYGASFSDFFMNYSIKAFGREVELEEKRKKISLLYPIIVNYSINVSKKFSGCTFKKTEKGFLKNKKDEYQCFIFADKTAAKQVDFNNFFETFYLLEESNKLIKEEIKKITEMFFVLVYSNDISVQYIESLCFEFSDHLQNIF